MISSQFIDFTHRAPVNPGTDLCITRFRSEPAHAQRRESTNQSRRTAMKTWMATAAAISLLAGASVASAQNAPAQNDKGSAPMEQSAAPKVTASTHKTRTHQAMRMKHRTASRVGTVGSG